MINRIAEKKIIGLAKKFPVVAIIGPRQSGKTTLTRIAFPDKPYVSLEDIDTREFAEKDPRAFLAQYPHGAILDEIQRVPTLNSYIQTIVDERPIPGQFILTGSHNYVLQEQLSQSLAGRIALFTLLPLSLEELQSTPYAHATVPEYLFHGLYPRVYQQHIAPTDWYPNYIQTYLERDVRLIKNISNLNTFQQFVQLCAGRIGQLLNLSSLANDCGITHNTARSWVSILESSFILFLLQPYHNNFSKRIIKMPKIYFYDTGIACSINNPAAEPTGYGRKGMA